MEARKFFEGSPNEEITVSATKEEWREVIEATSYAYWVSESRPCHELLRRLKEIGVT